MVLRRVDARTTRIDDGARHAYGKNPSRLSLRERERAAMEGSYRALDCEEAREGVGGDGHWCIDFHERLDYSDAVRACKLIEDFESHFVEDPTRGEHAAQDLPKLRQITHVLLTHGEEWGQRYDFHKLVENHDIEYIRATLPHVGGITEMMKIAAICETHAVGVVPHFTGTIATAAPVNCLGTFPGPMIMEYNYAAGRRLIFPSVLTSRMVKRR